MLSRGTEWFAPPLLLPLPLVPAFGRLFTTMVVEVTEVLEERRRLGSCGESHYHSKAVAKFLDS